MAQPRGHVVLGAEEAYAVGECYIALEAQLQALHQQNEELTCALQEQQEIVAIEWIKGNRRSRTQTQEFANLTTELLAG